MYCMSSSGGALRIRKNRLKKNRLAKIRFK